MAQLDVPAGTINILDVMQLTPPVFGSICQ
jgi:hypothetical protein